LHILQILLFVNKFIHHRQNLPDIFATNFTENSFIYNYNTRGVHFSTINKTLTELAVLLMSYFQVSIW